MSVLEILAIFAAGVVAGTINTVVGSGTLFTFPLLLSFGYAPVLANVSNTVGLVPGSVAGAWGYRAELRSQRERVARLAAASLPGACLGAALLLTVSAAAFRTIVVVIIVIAVVLVAVEPVLARLLADHRSQADHPGRIATTAVFATGVYGGYFGAAQGILLLAILGLALDDDLQRLNAVKVVLTGLVNLVSGTVFIFAAHIAWAPTGLIAAGSVIGGTLGARLGRRLPAAGLRVIVVIVGVFAVVRLLGT